MMYTLPMNKELYQLLQNRNARAQQLKAQGYSIKMRTTGPQQIHPQYIKDWHYALTDADKGIGNTLYKTYFPNLYVVEWEQK